MRQAGDKVNTLSIILYHFFILCVANGTFAGMGDYQRTMDLHDAFNMLMLCLCGLSGHVFLTRAYQVYDASKLAPFHYFEIVVGYLLDLAFFNNKPDLLSAIGTVMIISIGFILSKPQKEAEKGKK